MKTKSEYNKPLGMLFCAGLATTIIAENEDEQKLLKIYYDQLRKKQVSQISRVLFAPNNPRCDLILELSFEILLPEH